MSEDTRTLDEKIDEVVESIKKTSTPFSLLLIFFLIVNLVGYLVSMVFTADVDLFQFQIWMADNIDDFGTVHLSTHALAEIIIFGPFLSLVMVFCFRYMKRYWTERNRVSERKKRILSYLMVIAVILVNTGVFTNRLFNLVTEVLKDLIPETHPRYYMYIYAYYMDEILGHHLLNFGLSLFPFIMALLMPMDSKVFIGEERMNVGERYYLIPIPSIIYGVISGIMNLEGQSAVSVMIFNAILILVVILYISRKKTAIMAWNRPFLVLLILQTAVMLGYVLIWGIFTEFKLYYPFFLQPSELH
ncbi:MAG: hypothetical protein ACFFCS_13170 [Candidatus Hodarchaeota archaeon]